MTREELDDIADDYGYQHYHCPRHGGFWSDSGPYCAYCPNDKDPEEDSKEEEEGDGESSEAE